MKVIFDIGSNNGDNIPYYLLKCDKVIAIEANPELCTEIADRFQYEIECGRLIIRNGVIVTSEINSNQVPFYIHKFNHVLSQFPKPDDTLIQNFNQYFLPTINIKELVKEYGIPFYVKIDIENYDHILLRDFLRNDIKPEFISAESHSIDTFAGLVSLGYNSFKLVIGETVNAQYRNHNVITKSGFIKYSFPYHSAGPFGEDINGNWMSKTELLYFIVTEGLGWYDIHARKIDKINVIEESINKKIKKLSNKKVSIKYGLKIIKIALKNRLMNKRFLI